MLKISRNMQICQGDKACGKCLEMLPHLSDGPVRVAKWAYEHNKIEQVILDCPTGALEVEKI